MASRPSRRPSSRARSARRPSRATDACAPSSRPATGHGNRSSSRRVSGPSRRQSTCSAWPPSSSVRARTSSRSSHRPNPGRDLGLPVGPLRAVDAASGRVRTLLGGTVLAFFWAPDGKTIAAIGVPAPGDDKVASAGRAALVSTTSDRCRGRARREAAALVRQRRVGAIRSHWSFAVSDLFVDQVLPFLTSTPSATDCGPRMERRSRSRSSPRTAATRSWSSRRTAPDARPVASGVAAFWSPPLFHNKCAHYLCITSMHAKDASMTPALGFHLRLDAHALRSSPTRSILAS